jgi:hypothetical protein
MDQEKINETCRGNIPNCTYGKQFKAQTSAEQIMVTAHEASEITIESYLCDIHIFGPLKEPFKRRRMRL